MMLWTLSRSSKGLSRQIYGRFRGLGRRLYLGIPWLDVFLICIGIFFYRVLTWIDWLSFSRNVLEWILLAFMRLIIFRLAVPYRDLSMTLWTRLRSTRGSPSLQRFYGRIRGIGSPRLTNGHAPTDHIMNGCF